MRPQLRTVPTKTEDASAPLYLRTLWRYTNAVIIIIIILGDQKHDARVTF